MENENFNPGENVRPIRSARVNELRKERVGTLMHDLASDAIDLTRKEVELARTEVNDKIDQAENGVKSLVVGGAILFFGVQVILAAAVLGLSYVVEPWASALIIGGFISIVGAALLAKARSNLRARNLAPEATMETLRETARSTKEVINDERRNS